MMSNSKNATELAIRLQIRQSIQEAIDHGSINTITSIASKLYKAIESVEPKLSDLIGLQDALAPGLNSLKRSLEDVLQNPTAYVARQPNVTSASSDATRI